MRDSIGQRKVRTPRAKHPENHCGAAAVWRPHRLYGRWETTFCPLGQLESSEAGREGRALSAGAGR